MPVLLQIDACLNTGSTGRITEDIARLAQKQGWECYIIHGSRYVNPPSVMHSYSPGSVIDEYLHYAEHLFFDNDGLASRNTTRKAIEFINQIKPDVIHMHDIHDHWLNYRILFEYLNTINIPIVWTQHDCWTITGDCGYFSQLACNQWATVCSNNCPLRESNIFRKIFNNTQSHFNLKKRLFSEAKNLVLVPVSNWLEGVLKKSFLKDKPIKTILNGVDVNLFKPVEDCFTLQKYGLKDINYLVGVATAWSERKGFNDYLQLSSMISDRIKIVLVGLNEKLRIEATKYGIIGIPRTDNQEELVALYSGASIVMNLSYEETFGLTTVEGFACGTPSVVYNATASPELVTPETGVVCAPGDIDGVAKAIDIILLKGKGYYSNACRERAIEKFNKDDRYQEYINLYENLIKR